MDSISDKAPPTVKDLITLLSSKYNLRHDYILSLPKGNTTKYGLKSRRYYAAKKWNELENYIIELKWAQMKWKRKFSSITQVLLIPVL